MLGRSVPSKTRWGLVLLVLTALFGGASSGCSLGGPAKDVTKGTIRGSYDEIDAIDPAVQDRVVRKVMDSQAVHDSAHDLLVSVVGGGVDGFTEAERNGKINAFIDATLSAMRKQGDAAMGDFITRFDKQLAPVFRSLIRELVTSASAAFREAATRDLPAITSAILESAVRSFAIAAASTSTQMRAQARGFVQEDLGPLAGELTEQVARQAIIGVREGLHRELDLKDPQVREGMREIGIGLAQGVAQGTPTSPFTTTFAVASFVLAALLLVALCAAVAFWSRARTSAQVIAMLAGRLDGSPKSSATVEDMVGDASSGPKE
jgi:hypothetical protein